MSITRIGFYTVIWLTYLFFITAYTPLGSNWLEWHSQRIINAVQYLELNGFFSSYGFTIWTDCIDCNLDKANWQDKIYLSTHGVSLAPYIILNYFLGYEGLQNYAHFIDKTAIFFTAVIISELSIIFFKKMGLPKLVIGVVIFVLFVANPWTYKMIIAGWTEIYFTLFFLLGVLVAIHQHIKFGLVLFFLAGLFNFIWTFAFIIFYLLLSFIPKLTKNKIVDSKNFFPISLNTNQEFVYLIPFFTSFALILVLRTFASANFDIVSSSSFLERIGISGTDIHNGGILGALQFLGGNRVTQCVYSYEESMITSNLNLGIEAYNCILSITSLLVLSLVSIAGTFVGSIKFPLLKKITAPFSFSLLFLLLFFQQSFSAHLMGYSYIFSIIFSFGISYYFFNFISMKSNTSIRYIFALPIFLGILILCIRVSMLTGLNG